MENNDKNLIPLPIGELVDKQFFIPHYQRGYRWTHVQVEQLLDDIDKFKPEKKGDSDTFYCLQPVVVKLLNDETKRKHQLEGDWYEVVDGQQRLTTTYLIIQYINDLWTGRQKHPQFKLYYETRDNCVNFLKTIRVNDDDSVDIDKSNIDFYHISTAYQTIRRWELNYKEKNQKTLTNTDFQTKFFKHSQVIWYHVAPHVSSQELFERLNLGKIPLTNAELTKALFLSSESFKEITNKEEVKVKQIEIAQLWDTIEHKLNEPDLKFWSFITNKNRDDFETKIELVLDMISGKKENEQDPFYTFLIFSEKQKTKSLSDIWLEIEQFYYTVCEWYLDKDFYHKIGYLVACKSTKNFHGIELADLVKSSMVTPKNEFLNQIKNFIITSVKAELSELRYEDHYNQIFNILLLFNIETNRTTNGISEYYPFKQHKDKCWSIEHIHARHSEKFDKTKQAPWLKWLDLHKPILEELLHSEQKTEVQLVLDEIEKRNNKSLTWEKFDELFGRVNDLLTCDPESMDRDSEGIGNLALLSMPDNATLNNAVFEIKRREIIRLDKKGSFIPICTKRLFLKYYNEDGLSTQYFYWSETDREKYISSLKNKLTDYLPNNHIEKSDENE